MNVVTWTEESSLCEAPSTVTDRKDATHARETTTNLTVNVSVVQKPLRKYCMIASHIRVKIFEVYSIHEKTYESCPVASERGGALDPDTRGNSRTYMRSITSAMNMQPNVSWKLSAIGRRGNKNFW